MEEAIITRINKGFLLVSAVPLPALPGVPSFTWRPPGSLSLFRQISPPAVSVDSLYLSAASGPSWA